MLLLPLIKYTIEFHIKVLEIKYLLNCYMVKKKVDYSKLKVFGCQVFFYVPKQLRNKLTNSALPSIFIGYDNNPTAYKIYNTTNNKNCYFSFSCIF